MIQLKSVSKPPPSPRRNLEVAAAVEAPRKDLGGETGNAGTIPNLAKDFLLAKGKGAPIQRPATGGGALESVIGSDDRTRILETQADPWRMICALSIKSLFGSFIGTGWFVGPRTLVTAGHCVHEDGMGGWADRIEVSPGRNGNDFPFKTVEATRFSTVDRWIQTRDPDFDIGAIHLEEPLGEEVGWFSVGALTSQELASFLVNISGYPGDLGNGEEQWFHKNRILKTTARRIFYDVDTFGGQSGSPVWIYESDDAHPLAVGIHAYGTGGTPSDFGIRANSAPRIIPEVFDQIQAWIEADNDAAASK